jgi:hypothetical protein
MTKAALQAACLAIAICAATQARAATLPSALQLCSIQPSAAASCSKSSLALVGSGTYLSKWGVAGLNTFVGYYAELPGELRRASDWIAGTARQTTAILITRAEPLRASDLEHLAGVDVFYDTLASCSAALDPWHQSRTLIVVGRSTISGEMIDIYFDNGEVISCVVTSGSFQTILRSASAITKFSPQGVGS